MFCTVSIRCAVITSIIALFGMITCIIFPLLIVGFLQPQMKRMVGPISLQAGATFGANVSARTFTCIELHATALGRIIDRRQRETPALSMEFATSSASVRGTLLSDATVALGWSSVSQCAGAQYSVRFRDGTVLAASTATMSGPTTTTSTRLGSTSLLRMAVYKSSSSSPPTGSSNDDDGVVAGSAFSLLLDPTAANPTKPAIVATDAATLKANGLLQKRATAVNGSVWQQRFFFNASNTSASPNSAWEDGADASALGNESTLSYVYPLVDAQISSNSSSNSSSNNSAGHIALIMATVTVKELQDRFSAMLQDQRALRHGGPPPADHYILDRRGRRILAGYATEVPGLVFPVNWTGGGTRLDSEEAQRIVDAAFDPSSASSSSSSPLSAATLLPSPPTPTASGSGSGSDGDDQRLADAAAVSSPASSSSSSSCSSSDLALGPYNVGHLTSSSGLPAFIMSLSRVASPIQANCSVAVPSPAGSRFLIATLVHPEDLYDISQTVASASITFFLSLFAAIAIAAVSLSAVTRSVERLAEEMSDPWHIIEQRQLQKQRLKSMMSSSSRSRSSAGTSMNESMSSRSTANAPPSSPVGSDADQDDEQKQQSSTESSSSSNSSSPSPSSSSSFIDTLNSCMPEFEEMAELEAAMVEFGGLIQSLRGFMATQDFLGTTASLSSSADAAGPRDARTPAAHSSSSRRSRSVRESSPSPSVTITVSTAAAAEKNASTSGGSDLIATETEEEENDKNTEEKKQSKRRRSSSSSSGKKKGVTFSIEVTTSNASSGFVAIPFSNRSGSSEDSNSDADTDNNTNDDNNISSPTTTAAAAEQEEEEEEEQLQPQKKQLPLRKVVRPVVVADRAYVGLAVCVNCSSSLHSILPVSSSHSNNNKSAEPTPSSSTIANTMMMTSIIAEDMRMKLELIQRCDIVANGISALVKTGATLIEFRGDHAILSVRMRADRRRSGLATRFLMELMRVAVDIDDKIRKAHKKGITSSSSNSSSSPTPTLSPDASFRANAAANINNKKKKTDDDDDNSGGSATVVMPRNTLSAGVSVGFMRSVTMPGEDVTARSQSFVGGCFGYAIRMERYIRDHPHVVAATVRGGGDVLPPHAIAVETVQAQAFYAPLAVKLGEVMIPVRKRNMPQTSKGVPVSRLISVQPKSSVLAPSTSPTSAAPTSALQQQPIEKSD